MDLLRNHTAIQGDTTPPLQASRADPHTHHKVCPETSHNKSAQLTTSNNSAKVFLFISLVFF